MLPPEDINPFVICPKRTELTEEQNDFNIAIMNTGWFQYSNYEYVQYVNIFQNPQWKLWEHKYLS